MKSISFECSGAFLRQIIEEAFLHEWRLECIFYIHKHIYELFSFSLFPSEDLFVCEPLVLYCYFCFFAALRETVCVKCSSGLLFVSSIKGAFVEHVRVAALLRTLVSTFLMRLPLVPSWGFVSDIPWGCCCHQTRLKFWTFLSFEPSSFPLYCVCSVCFLITTLKSFRWWFAIYLFHTDR